MQHRERLVTAGLALVMGLSACGDATGPTAGRSVSLAFAARPPAGGAFSSGIQSLGTGSLTITVGNDVLVITDVKLVLREIELKRQETSDCDSTANENACEEFTLGPRLVDLPLDGGAAVAITERIANGTYTEIEFDVHKPGSDSLDLVFKAANPDFANISIRVLGTFNGQAFTFTSRLNEEQEQEFVPPLVISDTSTAANLTILLDVRTWFRNGATGPLINPASANEGQANENLVKDNIKASIDAFRDDDRDGDR